MPIAADPNDLVSFVLSNDRDKPNPATFHLRFLTMSQDLKIARLIQEAAAASKDKEVDKTQSLYAEVFKVSIVRIDGLLGATPENLAEHLTQREFYELLHATYREPAIKEDERKKSSSPAASDAPVTGESEPLSTLS